MAVLWNTYRMGQPTWVRKYMKEQIVVVAFQQAEDLTVYVSCYVSMDAIKKMGEVIQMIKNVLQEIPRRATVYFAGDFNFPSGEKNRKGYREEVNQTDGILWTGAAI